MQPSPYTIHSASAGSGKTSTLVKEYLKLVLDPRYPRKFQQILAITFTNKAVNEMKTRILDSLYSFSKDQNPDTGAHIFRELLIELRLTPQELQLNSSRVLKQLLHNYAFFDVSTIDKFTHRLIRTFARDLKLPQNFEVVLDTDLLLEEAIGRLLGRAGEDPVLTELLIAFALEKIDDNRSWDISYDLFAIGKLLFSENHQEHLKLLQLKDSHSFLSLKEHLLSNIDQSENALRQMADEILHAIADNDLERSDFKSGWFPDFMADFSQGAFQKINFNAGWKANFDKAPLYNKSCEETTKAQIDALLPVWRDTFGKMKEVFQHWSLLQNAYRNLVPLTILNAINREVDTLEKERDQLPISSFNSLIAKEIKDQPAPFIYERLGEKYRHYFIDEFQDTSMMQWENLIPLISSALESSDSQGNPGTLLLVGDVKQAIYRWRGGKAEQFLDLINGGSSPFTVTPQVFYKQSNFRSHREVVEFNNTFFHHISHILENGVYKQLYESGSKQQAGEQEGGQVQLQFIEAGVKSKDELYCEAISDCLEHLRKRSFDPQEICILTRTRGQGAILAEYLLHLGIPVISSETLLLQSHPKVGFLMAVLQYCQLPTDKQACYDLLYFLAEENGKHRTIARHLNDPGPFLLKNFDFDPQYVRHAPVYDGLEYAIRCFTLAEHSDAYLTFLLDEALTVEQKEDSSIPTFLDHWAKQKDRLSISVPEGMNAVQIMTIHKAKGLEFPIVLFPYANSDIYSSRTEKDARIWFPVDPDAYAGFNELLLSKKKEMACYNEKAKQLYQEEKEKLALDAFNVLYVACTRAEKALFIFTEKDLDAKGNPKTSYYSGMFIDFLMKKGLWEEDRTVYTFGKLRPNPGPVQEKIPPYPVPYQYSFKNRPDFRIITQSGMLWGSDRGEALSRGNVLHELMAHIERGSDLEPALKRLIQEGSVAADESDELRQLAKEIVDHAVLAPYYREGITVRNEAEIITKNGRILRPDRIVLNHRKATLLDYKTGKPNVHFVSQLSEYSQALEDMGYVVENKIIVYIDKGVFPEFI